MSSNQQQPRYRLYATLLDSYQWYLCSQGDDAFQDLINRINRVPFHSEAAAKGTAFNEVVDGYMDGTIQPNIYGEFIHHGFTFSSDTVLDTVRQLAGALPQIRVSSILPTRYGPVEVYGVIDELLPCLEVVDIKTTSSYALPKYLHNWQHIVYPYCLQDKTGCRYTFTYLVTDFKGVYKESYEFNPDTDVPRLTAFCEQFIEFLEQHRHMITDHKVFAEDDPSVLLATHDPATGVTIIENAA